jgi:hypothetical protein
MHALLQASGCASHAQQHSQEAHTLCTTLDACLLVAAVTLQGAPAEVDLDVCTCYTICRTRHNVWVYVLACMADVPVQVGEQQLWLSW